MFFCWTQPWAKFKLSKTHLFLSFCVVYWHISLLIAVLKELNIRHELIFCNPYIFATHSTESKQNICLYTKQYSKADVSRPSLAALKYPKVYLWPCHNLLQGYDWNQDKPSDLYRKKTLWRLFPTTGSICNRLPN